MTETAKSYGLFSETSGIGETRDPRLQRNLPLFVGLNWLGAGWRDLWHRPSASLAYGFGIFVLSWVLVWVLAAFGSDYILFPALAGFMIVGPFFAIGLHEKSRAIEENPEVGLAQMLAIHPRAGRQVFFTGLMLCALMLLWMRAAVIIYALFFGLRPFPGLDHIAPMLFATPVGWAMLIVGSAVGGLFAAFSFAISAFSIPMLLNERLDALTAMGSSMALVWNNLPVMLTWATIVLVLFLASLATGLLGLIIVFPLLGHGTWHAYRAIRPRTATSPA